MFRIWIEKGRQIRISIPIRIEAGKNEELNTSFVGVYEEIYNIHFQLFLVTVNLILNKKLILESESAKNVHERVSRRYDCLAQLTGE